MGTEPMNEPGPRLSSAAERMRLHRERRREGMRCLWIELHATEIDALVGLALLKPEMRNDPSAIREALYALYNSGVPFRTIVEAHKN